MVWNWIVAFALLEWNFLTLGSGLWTWKLVSWIAHRTPYNMFLFDELVAESIMHNKIILLVQNSSTTINVFGFQQSKIRTHSIFYGFHSLFLLFDFYTASNKAINKVLEIVLLHTHNQRYANGQKSVRKRIKNSTRWNSTTTYVSDKSWCVHFRPSTKTFHFFDCAKKANQYLVNSPMIYSIT